MRPPRRRRGLALRALLVAAAALAVAGCGAEEGAGDGGSEAADAEPVGEKLGGSVAQLVQCGDWVEGSEAEKLATIEDVRSHVNLEGTGIDAPALSDDEAMEVFDNACADPAASSFRLYVIYARAAAFKPLRDVAEGN